jgi:hypothetical protein
MHQRVDLFGESFLLDLSHARTIQHHADVDAPQLDLRRNHRCRQTEGAYGAYHQLSSSRPSL